MALDLFVVLPVILLTAGLSFAATFLAILKRTVTWKRAVLYYTSVVFLAYVAFEITSRCLIPAGIRFDFSYPGQVGTYHEVQFYFKQDGRWLEGPSVDGWPMKVSFPDLDGDGHRDIRVVPREGTGSVEFVYLPQNDGHIFWRAIKNDSGLSAAYLPANYFSNYP